MKAGYRFTLRCKAQSKLNLLRMGIATGRLEGESRLLRRLLEHRFGALPQWATEKFSSASEQTLEAGGIAPTLKTPSATSLSPTIAFAPCASPW